jgi:hypothetical protein
MMCFQNQHVKKLVESVLRRQNYLTAKSFLDIYSISENGSGVTRKE